jgi:predicted S18 family serine protease
VIDIKNLSSKIDNLAYSIERLNSAVSWSNFFDKGTKKYMINKDEIKNSCINKIYEAEERNEYLKLITAMNFETTEKDIGSARSDLENESYELCLFKASKAKAESDVILNTIGIDESQLLETTEQRLDVIRKNLIKEQQKGIFPVVGYSYYEYANDLKDKDIYSSMLFTEYSLELSNLDIYFKDNNESKFNLRLDIKYIIGISLTFISGILIGLGIGKIKPKKHSK